MHHEVNSISKVNSIGNHPPEFDRSGMGGRSSSRRGKRTRNPAANPVWEGAGGPGPQRIPSGYPRTHVRIVPPVFRALPRASHRRVDGARGGGGGPLLLGGGSAAWDPSRERKHWKESTKMEATMRLSGAHTSDFGARGSARGIPLAFGRRTGVPRGRANVQVSKGGGTAGREERGRRKKRVAREADEAIRPGASGKERKTERTGDAWSHDWTATTGAPRNAGTLRRPWIPRDRQVS